MDSRPAFGFLTPGCRVRSDECKGTVRSYRNEWFCASHAPRCFVTPDISEDDRLAVNRAVCDGGSFSHDDRWYCLFHWPDKDKHQIFKFAQNIAARLAEQRSDFRYVVFSDEVSITDRTLIERVDFSGAHFLKKITFNNIEFLKRVRFKGAVFQEQVEIKEAIFRENLNLGGAVFADVQFYDAQFHGKAFLMDATVGKQMKFNGGIISEEAELFISGATPLKNIIFRDTFCYGHILFTGEQGAKAETDSENLPNRAKAGDFSDGKKEYLFNYPDTVLDMRLARLLNADRISFEKVRLRPFWFVNCDPRKFSFTNINWEGEDGLRFGSLDYVKEEVKGLKTFYGVSDRPEELLVIAFRQLAHNAEENNRFAEASKFRRMAMDAEKLGRKASRSKWRRDYRAHFQSGSRWRNFTFTNLFRPFYSYPFGLIHFAYRLSSNYGESGARL
jgi:uncharacterized protein YjbI with pentapeptide repeats